MALLRRRGLIGASVRIKNDVDHGMLENERMESQLRSQSGTEIDHSRQPVHMGKWLFARAFFAMDGQVAYFNLEPQRDRVKAPKIHSSARGALEFSNHPLPRHLLK